MSQNTTVPPEAAALEEFAAELTPNDHDIEAAYRRPAGQAQAHSQPNSQSQPQSRSPPSPDQAVSDDGAPGAPQQQNVAAVMQIPVAVRVLIGSTTMPVAQLLKLGPGAIVPLDRRVGEPVDVVVNGRIVARGEVVILDNDKTRFGVALTELTGISPAPGKQPG